MIKQVEEKLSQSVQLYGVMLEHTSTLEGVLKEGDPLAIKSYVSDLDEIQGQLGRIDDQLLDLLQNLDESVQYHPLYQKRMALMRELATVNELLLPKINGMMAVTADERSRLKEGKAAVAGYHSGQAGTNRGLRGVG